jgi:hypothetical protein
MQSQFLKINVLAMTGCVITMYLTIVKWKMGVKGYIIGFMSKFIIELIYEIFYLMLNFPNEAKILPSFSSVKTGLWSVLKFSIMFVIGFSVEMFLFETVSFIFFQAPNPEENISLYMSLYQIHISGIIFFTNLNFLVY